MFCRVAKGGPGCPKARYALRRACVSLDFRWDRPPREAVLAVPDPGGYTPGMMILTNTGGVAMTNCFLIADEAARQAVLFDAPDHTTAALLEEAAARGWDLTGLWLTHGHFDHFADHAVVKRKFPAARILLHALDEAKALHPDSADADVPAPDGHSAAQGGRARDG